MKQFSIILGWFISWMSVYSQNIILNPGFEDHHYLQAHPVYEVDTFFCRNWTHIYLGYHSTVDYFSEGNCIDYSNNYAMKWLNIPDNDFGFHPAVSGKSYIGFSLISLDGGNMEHLTGLLKEPLRQGSKYKISFYLRFPLHTSRLFSSKIEVSFSSDSTYFKRKNLYIDAASYENLFLTHDIYADMTFDISVLKDTTGWINFSQTYVAKGGEKYLTFGLFHFEDKVHEKSIKLFQDFLNDSKTPYKKRMGIIRKIHKQIPFLSYNLRFVHWALGGGIPRKNHIVIGGDYSYYFIDDVSVVPLVKE